MSLSQPDASSPATPTSPSLVPAEFRYPRASDTTAVDLAGDFTEWSLVPMDTAGDEFLLVIGLEPGRSYRYRYLVNGERWDNDWAADEYTANDYGSEDSVRVVPGSGADPASA